MNKIAMRSLGRPSRNDFVQVVLSRNRYSTTNVIEGLNRQVTKTKSVFPSDSLLEKMLYLACLNVIKK